MALPRVLAHNLLDTIVLYPEHTVTINRTPAAGCDVAQLGANTRDLGAFTTIEPNAHLFVYLDCGVGRAVPATMLVYDRGHNVAGVEAAVAYSDDGVTYTDVIFTSVLRTVAGGTPEDAGGGGCRTSEGVNWLTWGHATPHRYWRLYAQALGVGIVPLLTGLYLGASYELPDYLDAPVAFERRKTTHARNEVSEGGVRVKSRPVTWHKLRVKLPVEGTLYPQFDVAVTTLLEYNHPWWFCPDPATAAGAALLKLYQLEGDTEYDPAADPVHREIDLELEEAIPRLRL